jgi:hypothetical protein
MSSVRHPHIPQLRRSVQIYNLEIFRDVHQVNKMQCKGASGVNAAGFAASCRVERKSVGTVVHVRSVLATVEEAGTLEEAGT